MPRRKFFKFQTYLPTYGASEVRNVPYDGRDDAELISSETEDGLHCPVIDLDFPCLLYPSTTPGHHHLYIDKPITWDAYKMLLEGFWKAGLIQDGWYQAALKDERSYVRRQGVYKPFDDLKERVKNGGELFQ